MILLSFMYSMTCFVFKSLAFKTFSMVYSTLNHDMTFETIEISSIILSLTFYNCSLRTDLRLSEIAGIENSNKFIACPCAEIVVVPSILIAATPAGGKSKAEGFSGSSCPGLNDFSTQREMVLIR